jgi:hypothetical protein
MVLIAFVTAGLWGCWGYREGRVAEHTDPFDVVVRYPAVTRGRLPTAWTLEIVSRDGSNLGRVEISTTRRYFDLFDLNELVPQPDSVSQDDEIVTWEYRDLDAPTIMVSLDVRTQPNARWRHAASATVSIDEDEVATLDYRTTVMP